MTAKTEALKLTLDSMAQGILSIGADRRTNFYNQRLLQLLELPEALMAGRPTMEDIMRYQLEHRHYGDQMELLDTASRAGLDQWLAGERPPFPASYFRRTRSGTVLEVKSRYLNDGAMVRTFTDVTPYFEAQRKLAQSEAQARKLALVAAHTDNAVTITDAQRRIEWVNEGFTRLTGYRLDEVVGHQASDLLRGPQTDAAETERMLAQLRDQGRTAVELQFQAKDGHPLWIAMDAQAILDDAGQVLQYVTISRNVGERKAAEEALRAARDEAQRASQAKSEFLSAMSHELRTPMNAILGFAQVLASDPACVLPARQQGQVREILRAGAHLLELINDVLDLARVEAGKQPIVIEPVAVTALLEDCVALMRPVALEHGIHLEVATLPACGCFVAADRTRLKQVLLNLMEAMLEHEPGVRLITAQDPLLGITLARTEQPQLILLDIQLPGIDGFEVLRRLRGAAATRDVPVIAISANAMRSDIQQGLDAGFNDYLTKPLDLTHLRERVRRALQR